MLVFACMLACAALVFLSLVPPPAPAGWRMLGLFAIGSRHGHAEHSTVPRDFAKLPERSGGHGQHRRHLLRIRLPGRGAAGGGHFLRAQHSHLRGDRAGLLRRHLCQLRHAPAGTGRPADAAASPARSPQHRRRAVCAAAVLPVRQRMVDRRLAAAFRHTPPGHRARNRRCCCSRSTGCRCWWDGRWPYPPCRGCRTANCCWEACCRRCSAA